MQIRHQFFLVVPPIMLMVSPQILYLFIGESQDGGNLAAIVMIAIIALLVLMRFCCVFLGLKPLPPGPARPPEARGHTAQFPLLKRARLEHAAYDGERARHRLRAVDCYIG